MTTALETWLQQATRKLSKDSAAQVRAEIQEHYEAAREAAISGGAAAAEADRSAVTGLGDAQAANRQYRRVLLTSAEARTLREAKWEARAVCSRPWLKGLFLAMPVIVLSASTAFFLAGEMGVARALVISGIGMSLLFAGPFLPIYTPSRARAFRVVKWVVLIGTLEFALGFDMLNWSWLVASCLWPAAWFDWTRVAIRRKLPVAEWPKALYL